MNTGLSSTIFQIVQIVFSNSTISGKQWSEISYSATHLVPSNQKLPVDMMEVSKKRGKYITINYNLVESYRMSHSQYTWKF